jgi:ribosomal-protein-alanine N-acetyltransferase
MNDLQIVQLNKKEISLENLASKLFIMSQEVYQGKYSWRETDFLGNLKNINNNYLLLLADQSVVGFLSFSYFFGFTAEISNFVISSAYQNQGWGRKMLLQLLSELKKEKINLLFLEVRSSNLKAQNLYYSLGFKKIRVRSKYYQKPAEDGFDLLLRLKKGNNDDNFW